VNTLSKWCALSAFAVLGLVAPSASAQVIPGANANGFGNFSEGFQAHERTGDASYSYDFALPAARGGKVTPSLSLVYSSSNGVGDAGDGFRLSMPTIEAESVPYGVHATMVPYGRWNYSGQALVKICDAGCGFGVSGEVYRLRFDDAHDRFVKLGVGGWRVFHKDGLVDDYFDTDADKSNEVPPRPVRFHLSERREWTASAGLGNRARYVWQVLGNRGLRYLTDTFDTPIAGTAPATDFAHHTKIYYESHDFEQTAYAPTWLAKQDMRIANIDVTSVPWDAIVRKQVRRYWFKYLPHPAVSTLATATDAPLPNHSYLKSIQMEGTCAGTSELLDGFVLAPLTPCPRMPAPAEIHGAAKTLSTSMLPRSFQVA
jgi:hypothetical protein